MPMGVVRNLLQIGLAAMAIGACAEAPRIDDSPPGGPDHDPNGLYSTWDEGGPAPADAGSEPPSEATTPATVSTADGKPLGNGTCQPNCLPLNWLADALRGAGLDVWEDPNWKTRGHGSFKNLWGVVTHHTGVDRDTEWLTVRDGRSDLAGPLSQLVLEKNGMFRVIASGVAWHAGRGEWPGLETNNANFQTIGIEAVNTGLESWSVEQYSAYVRGVAALLKYMGADASHMIGHKEWAGKAQGKRDPGNIDMDKFRADVQALIDGKVITAN